jgi:hypothetical protein
MRQWTLIFLLATLVISAISGCCTTPSTGQLIVPTAPKLPTITHEQSVALHTASPEAFDILGRREKMNQLYIDLLVCEITVHNSGGKPCKM